MQPKDDLVFRRFRIVYGDDVSLSVMHFRYADTRNVNEYYEVGLIVYDYTKHKNVVADTCRISDLNDLFSITSRVKDNDYSDFPEYEEKYRERMQALTDQVYAMGGGAD